MTAFLDAHTFDTRRVMKCCLAHLLPSGHMVPFCAYNTLYRDGFLTLPPLVEEPIAANNGAIRVLRQALPLVPVAQGRSRAIMDRLADSALNPSYDCSKLATDRP